MRTSQPLNHMAFSISGPAISHEKLNHFISTTIFSMATKHGRVVTYFEELQTIKSITLWVLGLAKSHGKQKPLYFQYQSVYCHHTWQDGNLLLQVFTHKVTWNFDHEFTTTVFMTTKLCRMVSYLEVLKAFTR